MLNLMPAVLPVHELHKLESQDLCRLLKDAGNFSVHYSTGKGVLLEKQACANVPTAAVDGVAAVAKRVAPKPAVLKKVTAKPKPVEVIEISDEKDSVRSRGDVAVIAATNRPDNIDPALLRPGRFDRQLYVGPPNEKDREEIFSIHLRKTPYDSDVSMKELAQLTDGYTGADISLVCRQAALAALEENFDASVVTMKHFKMAIEQVQPSEIQFYQKFSATFHRGVRSDAVDKRFSMASRIVSQQQPKGDAVVGGGKPVKKNGAAGEGRNRRALLDIGNVKQVCANVPTAAVDGVAAVAKRVAPKPAVQKKVTAKPKPVQKEVIEISDEKDSEDKAVHKKKEADLNSKKKPSHTLTSVLTARSKAACGLTNKPKEIVDIDAGDANNELAAVEYLEYIYKFYKIVENENRPHDYMGSQPEINEKTRALIG
ncbi:unnamed protein product [Trifolium pratense]|uniref:Uncharacterized protein n=1 Tax=Trifolium pratense TaxID=57577 RepID=A0ACB0LQT4_TRIPR|nr:unnamed protein product [Trifolium pratense]